jgi:hypothetical protein
MVQLTAEEALPWVRLSDYPGHDLPEVMQWNRLSPDRREPPVGRGARIRQRPAPRQVEVTVDPQSGPTPPVHDDAEPDSGPSTDKGQFLELPEGTDAPGTTASMVYRKQRDTKVSKAVKALYNNRCQICLTRIVLATGFYSEGAHIRPIGEPHNGADKVANMLCLCPNHHITFDRGGLYVAGNLFVYERDGSPIGPLTVDAARHLINPANFEYHRKLHGFE